MTNPVLRLDADLRFTLADGGRRASGSVVAAGDTVTVTVDRPWAAVRSLRSADVPGGTRRRTDLAPLADALGAAGLRLAVAGPNGRLLTLGHDVESRLGRRLLGSARVAVRPRALVAARRAQVVLATGVLAAAALVGLRAAGGRSRDLPVR